MTENSPDTQVLIVTQTTGFYEGFNPWVAAVPKVIIAALLIWIASSPADAGAQLLALQSWSTASFAPWYMLVTAFLTLACLALGIWPSTGRLVLGKAGETPEFSRFTWLSMMFGAGIGVGMLTYSTAEPIFHFTTNPETIQGLAQSQDADNVRNAYKWALLHYGLTPWACYGIVGMALGYLSHAKGMPLTIRSGLQPIFGRRLSGWFGNLVDIAAILATLIGLGVTIGYGVSQFAAGLFNISGLSFLMNSGGQPTLNAQLFGLILIISASCISASSGIQRGIKWLSNINMSLSIFLVGFFILFGSTFFAVTTFGYAIWDYLLALPSMSVTIWDDTSTEVGKALQDWQGAWNIFYWAWWIAFAPFVGLFLARVSRGRSVREYVLGAIIVPSGVCLTWLAFVGATAIDLELRGVAQGAIVNADISSQLFTTINLMLPTGLAIALSVIVVVLLLTFLITSADSGVLIINTLASGGNQHRKGKRHIVVWGAIFTVLIGALLTAGGLGALRSAMIIGALPFSAVMALMAISLVKVMRQDIQSPIQH